MSQITTHVLDTAAGKPAEGIRIFLQGTEHDFWIDIASGGTNEDGRISNFMKDDQLIEPGVYRMIFKTKSYS